jgi:hypothetical protein
MKPLSLSLSLSLYLTSGDAFLPLDGGGKPLVDFLLLLVDCDFLFSASAAAAAASRRSFSVDISDSARVTSSTLRLR